MGNVPSKRGNYQKPSKNFSNIDNKLLFDDEKEIDRVQVEHMFRSIWGGNFLAPVTETLTNGGAYVLDYG